MNYSVIIERFKITRPFSLIKRAFYSKINGTYLLQKSPRPHVGAEHHVKNVKINYKRLKFSI